MKGLLIRSQRYEEEEEEEESDLLFKSRKYKWGLLVGNPHETNTASAMVKSAVC